MGCSGSTAHLDEIKICKKVDGIEKGGGLEVVPSVCEDLDFGGKGVLCFVGCERMDAVPGETGDARADVIFGIAANGVGEVKELGVRGLSANIQSERAEREGDILPDLRVGRSADLEKALDTVGGGGIERVHRIGHRIEDQGPAAGA